MMKTSIKTYFLNFCFYRGFNFQKIILGSRLAQNANEIILTLNKPRWEKKLQ